MNYKPTRQDFEKFLKDTNQTDAPFFYEQWILDNFRHIAKPLEEAYKKKPYCGAEACEGCDGTWCRPC